MTPRTRRGFRGEPDFSCHARGLSYYVNYDEPEPGIYTVLHEWQSERVTERQTRASIDRLRSTLTAEGWRLDTDAGLRTDSGFEELRLVLGELDVDWAVTAAWDNDTRTMSVSVHSPCMRLPDGD